MVRDALKLVRLVPGVGGTQHLHLHARDLTPQIVRGLSTLFPGLRSVHLGSGWERGTLAAAVESWHVLEEMHCEAEFVDEVTFVASVLSACAAARTQGRALRIHIAGSGRQVKWVEIVQASWEEIRGELGGCSNIEVM